MLERSIIDVSLSQETEGWVSHIRVSIHTYTYVQRTAPEMINRIEGADSCRLQAVTALL